MENQPVIHESEKRLYGKASIFFGSYFFGPLAVFYFLSKNFEVLGQKDLAKRVLKFGIIATIIFFAGILFVPMTLLDKLPDALIPLIYTLCIYAYFRQTQEIALDEHLKQGVKKHSGFRVMGIGLIAAAISILYIFFLVYLLNYLLPDSWISMENSITILE